MNCSKSYRKEVANAHEDVKHVQSDLPSDIKSFNQKVTQKLKLAKAQVPYIPPAPLLVSTFSIVSPYLYGSSCFHVDPTKNQAFFQPNFDMPSTTRIRKTQVRVTPFTIAHIGQNRRRSESATTNVINARLS